MLIDALLYLFNAILKGFLLLRPDWQPQLPDSVEKVVASAMALNEILPVTEVFACVSLLGTGIIAFVTWKWVVKLLDWIADIIP